VNCLRMLVRYRGLIWNLVLLELRLRYAGSRLGLLWVLLVPLVVLGSYLFLFGKILQVQAIPGVTGFEYGLLVACGLLPWLGFSEGITRGTASVLAQRNLMKSRVFPMELVPVTSVCVALLGQLCGTVLLLAVVGIRGELGASLVLLPVLFLLQALFTIGVVWFLSCVNILCRDTSQVVGLLMLLLMFVSPIAYTERMVPSGLDLVVKLNPLSYLIDAYRVALLADHEFHLEGLVVFGGLTFLSLMVGYRYFMRLRRVLPDFV